MRKYENERWIPLTPIHDNYGFNAIAYGPDKQGKLILEINWEYIYGKLKKGTYRIVKNAWFNKSNDNRKQLLYAEFNI